MPRRRTATLAIACLAVAFCAPAPAEDLFDVLAGEEAAAEQAEAAEPSTEEPAIEQTSGELPWDDWNDIEEEPGADGAEAGSPETVAPESDPDAFDGEDDWFDAEADDDLAPLLVMPPDEQLEPPAPTEPKPLAAPPAVKAEAVATPLPAPAAVEPIARPRATRPTAVSPAADLLRRGLAIVTVDAAPSPRVAGQSENLRPENQIRDVAAERFTRAPTWVTSVPLGHGGPGPVVAWAAPALYHRPLPAEQPNLERYGHYVAFCRCDNLTQSAISGAHFFGGVATLPYLIGAKGFCEPQYVLGEYRPGSCNPHRLVKPEWSWRGLAAQGAAATGAVYFVP